MTLRSITATTVAGYRTRTGDTTTVDADVNTALDDAETQIAEHLRRSIAGAPALATEERTATLRIHPDGRVYPPAYPVTACADLTVENSRMLLGATPVGSPFATTFSTSIRSYASVTWTGGYTPSTLPTTLRNAVYDHAHALATARTPVPVGASSVSLGDASVSFATGTEPSDDLDTLVPGLSGRITRYMNRLGDGLA